MLLPQHCWDSLGAPKPYLWGPGGSGTEKHIEWLAQWSEHGLGASEHCLGGLKKMNEEEEEKKK